MSAKANIRRRKRNGVIGQPAVSKAAGVSSSAIGENPAVAASVAYHLAMKISQWLQSY